MKLRKLTKFRNFLNTKRTVIVYVLLVTIFSGVLQQGESYSTKLFLFTLSFSMYTYVDIRRKYQRPRDPKTHATLKVSTEPNVDWAITTDSGELVISGWGSRTVELPSNKTFIDRARKVKYSEYLYVAEVLSGNGDAFVSLTVEDEDEFAQTVACSRSGESEVLYASLNTGYGTKHWLIPGFLQGIPN